MGVRWTALVVNDATSSGGALVRELEDAGAKVLTARSTSEGFGHLIDGPIDVAIVDVELAAQSGLSVLHHFRSEGGQTPVLLLSDTDDPVVRSSAFGQGCDDYFVKPVTPGEVVARALRRMEVHQALRAARAESERLH